MLSESASKVRIANKNGASLGRPAAIPVSLQGCRRNGRREAAVQLLDLASPTIANAPLVRVFVNHPAISPTTLPEGPHYVGTFSFFGTAAQHQVLRTVEASSGQRFSAEDLCITDPDDATAQAATSVSVELPLTQALQRLDAARKPIGDTLTSNSSRSLWAAPPSRSRSSRRRSKWSSSDVDSTGSSGVARYRPRAVGLLQQQARVSASSVEVQRSKRVGQVMRL